MSSDPSGRWKEQFAVQLSDPQAAQQTSSKSRKTNTPVSPRIPLQATQHVRRMRGGTQPHLMGCSDGNYYVVKFPNNPQGARTLVNELLCAHLAQLLNLPTPPAAVVSVSDDLIHRTVDLSIQTPGGSSLCQAGPCFGSQYPTPEAVIFEFWPKRRIHDVANLSDFAGMMVFDIWISNIDFRQVRYLKESPTGSWKAIMFDNSLAFRGAEWSFCDKPRLVVNPLLYVYEFIGGMSSFDPWLTLVERIEEDDLWEAAGGIPAQWYGADSKSLSLLLEQLWTRRTRVRELIHSLRVQSPKLFPNWKFTMAVTG